MSAVAGEPELPTGEQANHRACGRTAPAALLALVAVALFLISPAPAKALIQFDREFGGPGDGTLAFPGGVATDSSGNVYVADRNNKRVEKFDSGGAFLASLGKPHVDLQAGEVAGAGAADVATDLAGNLYIAGQNRIQKVNSSGVLVTEWGEYGRGNGKFDEEEGVATDSAGNVYVADLTYNTRIQKFNSSGVFLTKWGSAGTAGGGEFRGGGNIATDSAGNVYVADRGNNRIQKFNSSGAFLRMWGWGVDDGSPTFQTCTSSCQAGSSGSGDGQFYYPVDVATDSAGNVYVADSRNHRIQKFDSAGNFVAKWGSEGSGSGQFLDFGGIATDSAGSVYVTDHHENPNGADQENSRVQKFSSSGVFLDQWGHTTGVGDGELRQPKSLATGPTGDVYVADEYSDRIQKFDSSGSFMTQWGGTGSGNGQLRKPRAVATDAAGNVYVVDSNNGRIQKFDSAGSFLTKWGTLSDEIPGDGEFSSPRGVATDSTGDVYVADSGNNRIQKFDSSGAFLTKWGTEGSAGGEFMAPYALATDSANNVYVVERNNNRIQKFNSSGAFLRMWGWGVDDGSPTFQTCTSSCQAGSSGSGNGQLFAPEGIATDSADHVYVADYGNNRIQEFSSSGTFLAKWGSRGPGNGEFGFPSGVATDSSGNIYVAEWVNDRIQKFYKTVPVSEEAPADGTVSTGSTTTPDDPVATSVTTPVAGTVTIDEGLTTTPDPGGYSLLGQQVVITAPAASAADPLALVFVLDASLLPPGVDEATLQVFRNGTPIADCDAGAGMSATPDPCVADRAATIGGAQLTVRTSHASTWNLGVKQPPETTIGSGPDDSTNDPTPTFGFSSSQAGSSFQCKLDSGPYAACSSPKTTGHLSDGLHHLYVRAIKNGVTDPTPASHTFYVRTAAVSVSGSTLMVTTATGAKDNLSITRPSASALRVTDLAAGAYTGSGVHAGTGCIRSGDYTANCNAAGVTLVKVIAGDQIDKVTNSTTIRGSLDGGADKDTLEGGSVKDTLTGGTGVDVLKGMNGNDQLMARDLVSDTTIDCGAGTADKADLDLLPKDPTSKVIGCETKTRH
jgi:uncharacterized protein YjiK